MEIQESRSGQEEDFFKDHQHVETGGLTVPNHILYLLIAVSFTAVALFAIIKHLIQDLIHDLADYLFGEQPVQEQECPWEKRDKFSADWIPEPVPDLEAILQDEEILELMQRTEDLPSILVLSDRLQPRAPSSVQFDVGVS